MLRYFLIAALLAIDTAVGTRAALSTPSARLPALRRGSRGAPPCMLARKPFKGGKLDDFLDAAEAEAKYGPRRYAAVAEDAWKIQVEQTKTEEERKRSLELYAKQKTRILHDHTLLSVLGTAAMWSFTSAELTGSYAFGTLMGGFYLLLKQRETDAFGTAGTSEAVRAGPPPLVIPVLMVLIVGKNKAVLSLVPALAGFFTNILATVSQLAYSEDA